MKGTAHAPPKGGGHYSAPRGQVNPEEPNLAFFSREDRNLEFYAKLPQFYKLAANSVYFLSFF